MTGNNYKKEDLLIVQDLKKYFPIRGGLLQRTVAQVKAVDGVSFVVKKGETLGLVGESGCGKTTVGRTILRLTPATSGTVTFEGRDVFKLRGSQLKGLRRDMQIIFQDPYSSLDPRMPVGESVAEGLAVHGIANTEKAHGDRDEMSSARWAWRIITPAAILTSSQEASASASSSPGPWRCAPSSSSAMSRSQPWMSPSRRRCINHPERATGGVPSDLSVHRTQPERG
jgi:ABC-type dipeptide/oligopeptide/nickel transport system ATPase component